WSILAFAWWLTALALIARARHRKLPAPPSTRPTVTVFKPLPPIRNDLERNVMAEAIGSFIGQLKSGDEVLIGMNEADATKWQPKFQAWRAAWTAAQIHVIAREIPRQCANPKIAWLQVLAPSASGEVWLWSDTDVTAPPGFLDAMCAQLVAGGCDAVTTPYVVQHVSHSHEVLDALFVNLEFLPGALLLGRLKKQDFAYGAATAFRAETFHAKGDWQKLGSALADDHKLGELLQPVALSSALVSTVPSLRGWGEAWQHYYRWHKTVRWCRTSGYAALLMLLPVFGWTLAGFFGGFSIFILSGLISVLMGEILVAVLACGLVGCRLPPTTWLGVLLWPVFRAATWLLVWLPLPVLWSGRKRAWFSPQQN
ncbi:MAG TPA: glycosyltransferase family 2 protein, partial [Candidatus Binatia bacterium]|nr:glycosyltransferase family 2 protein [Candidatus Binatia bacterium]